MSLIVNHQDLLATMKKAYSLEEVDMAVNKFAPISPVHPFYTDFSTVRGDFQDHEVYRILNVSYKNGKYTFNRPNSPNKTLLFLAGMRGSGKTSELAKYASCLENPECFFCITCNIDTELDMNDVEYMDIVILQLQKLSEKLNESKIEVDKGIVESMQRWFDERVVEINQSFRKEGSAEMESSAGTPGLLGFLKITFGLKAGISASKERATTIRHIFRNRFSDFALKFNEFIEQVNMALQKNNLAKEVLFIIDGLEKTLATDLRRKIILEESNRIKQIKANTIFTLPVELMAEQINIRKFAEVISFPFVKIITCEGEPVETAISKFEEMVLKRIDASLFDNTSTIRMAILNCGGSPVILLRILETANWFVKEGEEKITGEVMQKAIAKLAKQYSAYITQEGIEQLKLIAENNKANRPTLYSSALGRLMEQEIIMEYNDGTFKCINPLVLQSELYRQYVGD